MIFLIIRFPFHPLFNSSVHSDFGFIFHKAFVKVFFCTNHFPSELRSCESGRCSALTNFSRTFSLISFSSSLIASNSVSRNWIAFPIRGLIAHMLSVEGRLNGLHNLHDISTSGYFEGEKISTVKREYSKTTKNHLKLITKHMRKET